MHHTFVIAGVLLLACACTKKASQASLVGNWRLLSLEGGSVPGRQTQLIPADSPVILTFNSDLTFQIHAKGSLVGTGTYRAIDTSLYGSTPVPVIVFGPQNYQVYKLAFLTLVVGIGDEAYDGEQSTYIRAN